MSGTVKINLFDDEKTDKLNDFYKRYENFKKGEESNFYFEDLDILTDYVKNKNNVINSLDNKYKELKNELEKYKIEYQKLYNLKEKYEKELNDLKSKSFIPRKRIQQITEQQILDIKKLRDEGLSYSEIECQTKWSKYTISRVLNGHYDKNR